MTTFWTQSEQPRHLLGTDVQSQNIYIQSQATIDLQSSYIPSHHYISTSAEHSI